MHQGRGGKLSRSKNPNVNTFPECTREVVTRTINPNRIASPDEKQQFRQENKEL